MGACLSEEVNDDKIKSGQDEQIQLSEPVGTHQAVPSASERRRISGISWVNGPVQAGTKKLGYQKKWDGTNHQPNQKPTFHQNNNPNINNQNIYADNNNINQNNNQPNNQNIRNNQPNYPKYNNHNNRNNHQNNHQNNPQNHQNHHQNHHQNNHQNHDHQNHHQNHHQNYRNNPQNDHHQNYNNNNQNYHHQNYHMNNPQNDHHQNYRNNPQNNNNDRNKKNMNQNYNQHYHPNGGNFRNNNPQQRRAPNNNANNYQNSNRYNNNQQMQIQMRPQQNAQQYVQNKPDTQKHKQWKAKNDIVANGTYPTKPSGDNDMIARPPTRQQKQHRRHQKATAKKNKAKPTTKAPPQPTSVWDVNENDVDSDETNEWRKKSVMAAAAKRKSFVNYNEDISAPPKRGQKTSAYEGRRRSVFDDSSSDDTDSDNGQRRLTVDMTDARNASVSSHVNMQ